MRIVPITTVTTFSLATLLLTGCGSDSMFDLGSGEPTEPCTARMTTDKSMTFACDDKGTETVVTEDQLWRSSANTDNPVKQTLPLNGGVRIVDHARQLGGGNRIIVEDENDRRWTYEFDNDSLVSIQLHMS